jgi:hypothetical protein
LVRGTCDWEGDVRVGEGGSGVCLDCYFVLLEIW